MCGSRYRASARRHSPCLQTLSPMISCSQIASPGSWGGQTASDGLGGRHGQSSRRGSFLFVIFVLSGAVIGCPTQCRSSWRGRGSTRRGEETAHGRPLAFQFSRIGRSLPRPPSSRPCFGLRGGLAPLKLLKSSCQADFEQRLSEEQRALGFRSFGAEEQDVKIGG